MPKTFKTENWVPPGGYQYTQKESGQTFLENYWANLVAKVRAHRQANNYPTGANFQQELVDFNCELNPEWCQDTSPPTLAGMVKSFTLSMAKWISSGLKIASPEEWKRRREICGDCSEFRGDAGNNFSARCGRCSCFVVKLHLDHEKCPKQLW